MRNVRQGSQNPRGVWEMTEKGLCGAERNRARKERRLVLQEMTGRKFCSACGEPYGLESFYRSSNTADGRHNACKGCVSEQQRRRRAYLEMKGNRAA